VTFENIDIPDTGSSYLLISSENVSRFKFLNVTNDLNIKIYNTSL